MFNKKIPAPYISLSVGNLSIPSQQKSLWLPQGRVINNSVFSEELLKYLVVIDECATCVFRSITSSQSLTSLFDFFGSKS